MLGVGRLITGETDIYADHISSIIFTLWRAVSITIIGINKRLGSNYGAHSVHTQGRARARAGGGGGRGGRYTIQREMPG